MMKETFDSDNRLLVNGMILKHRPVGEYDFTVSILTMERGKISAFARGARKPGGKLSGNVEPFCYAPPPAPFWGHPTDGKDALGYPWSGWWRLCENPLEALDGKTAHILYGIRTRHNDVHTCKTAHWAYVNHIVLSLAVAEPSGHQVLQTMHGCWGNGWLLVGLGDT